MIRLDRGLTKLAAAAVADQTPAGEEKNNRINHRDQPQQHQPPYHFIGTKESGRTDSSSDDDDKAGDLRKIPPCEKLTAATSRAAAKMVLIVESAIPFEIDFLGRGRHIVGGGGAGTGG